MFAHHQTIICVAEFIICAAELWAFRFLMKKQISHLHSTTSLTFRYARFNFERVVQPWRVYYTVLWCIWAQNQVYCANQQLC